MHWATDYIGIPWEFGGRDPKGLDCYGLFRYVQEKHYGLELIEIEISEYNSHNVIKEFDSSLEFESWVEVDTPKDGDAVLLRMSKYPNHVGIWIEDGETTGVLHTVEKTGAMFSNRQNLEKAGWKVARFYRHKNKL